MWLFNKDGFLSIVEHRDDPDMLIVRARMQGDIERFWPEQKIWITRDADYLYRAYISKERVAAVLWKMAKNIDYDKFKPAVSDHRRSHWYLKVWQVLDHMQHTFAKFA